MLEKKTVQNNLTVFWRELLSHHDGWSSPPSPCIYTRNRHVEQSRRAFGISYLNIIKYNLHSEAGTSVTLVYPLNQVCHLNQRFVMGTLQGGLGPLDSHLNHPSVLFISAGSLEEHRPFSPDLTTRDRATLVVIYYRLFGDFFNDKSSEYSKCEQPLFNSLSRVARPLLRRCGYSAECFIR